MVSGSEIRAGIDDASVKWLVIGNGGGALALLTFLTAALTQTELHYLVSWTASSLLIFHIGICFTMAHNFLRRKCSEAHERRDAECSWRLPWLGFEPCVCQWSYLCMALGFVAFLSGGLVMYLGVLFG